MAASRSRVLRYGPGDEPGRSRAALLRGHRLGQPRWARSLLQARQPSSSFQRRIWRPVTSLGVRRTTRWRSPLGHGSTLRGPVSVSPSEPEVTWASPEARTLQPSPRASSIWSTSMLSGLPVRTARAIAPSPVRKTMSPSITLKLTGRAVGTPRSSTKTALPTPPAWSSWRHVPGSSSRRRGMPVGGRAWPGGRPTPAPRSQATLVSSALASRAQAAGVGRARAWCSRYSRYAGCMPARLATSSMSSPSALRRAATRRLRSPGSSWFSVGSLILIISSGLVDFAR